MRILSIFLIIVLLCGCQGSPATNSSNQAEHNHEHSRNDGDGHSNGEKNEHENHGEHEEEEGFVVLSAPQKKELGLKFESVKGVTGQSTGIRPGRIEADPDNRVILSVQASGTLHQVYAKVGQEIRAGELVALVSSPEVTLLQSEYHEAEAEAELARKELLNKTSLVEVGDEIQRPIETAQLELAQAKAQQEAVAAKLGSARLKNERLKTLLEDGIASQQQVDESLAERRALEAELKQAGTSVEISTLHLAREKRVAKSQLSAKATTFPAEASLARASERMEHAKERLLQLGADPDSHDGMLRVLSTITGIVAERPLARGEMLTPGKPIALVIDSSKVWVWVDLQRSDLDIVKQGDTIEVSLVNNPRFTADGSLDYIAPEVDEKTQTIRARVILENPNGKFLLGSFVNARVSSFKGKKVPAVSQAAVQYVEDQTVVYVREEAGFRRTPVTLGPSTSNGLITVEGLEPGVEVVASGAEQLKSLDLSDKIGGHSH